MNWLRTHVYDEFAHEILAGLMIGLVLTSFTNLIGLYAGWITENDWITFFAVMTSYTCTYLCVVQNRYNYLFGLVSVILYAYVFYAAGLFGNAALSIYLIFQIAYGWWHWGERKDTLLPRRGNGILHFLDIL